MADDHELIDAWKAGDRVAGDALMRRHLRMVLIFLAGKLPDQGVKDVAQQVFLEVARSIERLREGGSFRAFLLAIARHKLVDHLRTQKRHADHFDPLLSSVQDGSASPSVDIAADEQRDHLLEQLRTIPLDFQLCLELHYWQDFSVAEIAQVLEIPPGTVKSRLSRARELLRTRL